MTSTRRFSAQHSNSPASARRTFAGIWPRFAAYLCRDVNGASLGFFRLALGVVMLLESVSLFLPNPAAITTGTPLKNYYAGENVRFSFPYDGFEWLPLLPPSLMTLDAVAVGVFALLVALGVWYRVAIVGLFLTWGYLYTVECTRTYWQSHYYLETLSIFLLIWMPADRRLSLKKFFTRKAVTDARVPYWTIFLLRWQLVIAYFYAGVAKISIDWIYDAFPVRWFLSMPDLLTPYKPYLTAAQVELATTLLHSVAFAYFISIVGLVFDLAIGFVLLVPRTRMFGLALMLIFHSTNLLLIFDDISWFPLLGATTALIFLEPDWPERLVRWLRRPRIKRPDLAWFWSGLVCFPVVGGLLGWKLDPTDKPVSRGSRSRWVVPLVLLWLAWQTWMPLRHYFIAGDGRLTYEGLSFSWRLKADSHHYNGLQMIVSDREVVSRIAQGKFQIDWRKWLDEPRIYRELAGSSVNWRGMPEVAVVLQPGLGERVVYNPLSAASHVRGEEAVQARINQFWQESYGRLPEIQGTLSLPELLIELWQVASRVEENPTLEADFQWLVSQARAMRGVQPSAEQLQLFQRKMRDGIGALRSNPATQELTKTLLARTEPFCLDGGPELPARFYLIADPILSAKIDDGSARIRAELWKAGDFSREPQARPVENLGHEPLVVYFSGLGALEPEFPTAYIADFFANPARAPMIRWNSIKDLTMSKYMHVSGQAFLLRRYARRVAADWEARYGRRPTIHALTSVSLNRRPHQLLVDPRADLATVPAYWFRHNEWIRDLETERIPRDALVAPEWP